ncbi:MAG TPA: hypothetical protein VFS32_04560 [Candidatus Limnocylindrales bacterium]|nr:hypothetical protein [Candidatus Limnocylindrales bacterium]
MSDTGSDKPISPQPPLTSDDEDTEGQSLAALLTMRELSKAPRPKTPSDDALPPLTKKFPRMRSDPQK